MKLPNRIALIAASAVITLSPIEGFLSRAHAQVTPTAAPAAPVSLEPVKVTADLWETPLERLPASVSVYDDAALRAGAVRHFGDLVDQIPNLTWSGGTSRPRYLQIRGIGENSQYEGETPDSTVRFQVDDLDFTGLGGVAGTFDVRQVEVLRGPQAGAFGANAAGGLVRLVTNAPTTFWSGQVEAGVGEHGLREGGLAFGGPVTTKPDGLMFRLALHSHRDDGFRHNVTLNRDTNARDEFNARLRLTANPSPAWHFEAALLYSDLDNGFDEFALDNNGKRTFSDQPGRDAQRTKAASLRGVFSGWANVRLTTVSSGSWVDSVYSYDDDWTAASYAGFSDLRRKRKTLNQELRLDSATTHDAFGWIDRWTFGGFVNETKETGTYTDTDPFDVRGLRSRYHAQNEALFGQVSHSFDAATRLIVGLRGEHIDLNGRGVKSRFRKTRNAFDREITFAPVFDDTLWGGKVTLEHDLNANELVFAALTRGYKAGGINIDARINPPADPLTYETETLWNYEAGLRGRWLESRITGEVTLFYLQRRDTQVRDSAGFGGNYRFFTSNGHAAHVSGLEAAARYAITPEWSWHASFAQMDSQLGRFTLTNGNTGGGRALANTPRYGYTFGTRYATKEGLFASAEVVGRATQFDSNNQNEARRAFHVFNATLGYTQGPWSITLWGRNLANERYEKRVFFFGNADPDYIETRYEDRADPRQVGVTVGYRF